MEVPFLLLPFLLPDPDFFVLPELLFLELPFLELPDPCPEEESCPGVFNPVCPFLSVLSGAESSVESVEGSSAGSELLPVVEPAEESSGSLGGIVFFLFGSRRIFWISGFSLTGIILISGVLCVNRPRVGLVDIVGRGIERKQTSVLAGFCSENFIGPFIVNPVAADQAGSIRPAGERIVQIFGRPVCGCHIIREGDGECFVLPSFCPFPVHIYGLPVLCALCKPV